MCGFSQLGYADRHSRPFVCHHLLFTHCCRFYLEVRQRQGKDLNSLRTINREKHSYKSSLSVE
jgi:hypothetical protein